MTAGDRSVDEFVRLLEGLTPVEITAVALLIEGFHSHPTGWKPPFALADMTPADEHVLDTVRLLVLHPHWNRDNRGRFRKMPTHAQIYAESLAIAKRLREFQGEAEQAAIAHWMLFLGTSPADIENDNR